MAKGKSLEELTDPVFYILIALVEPRHGYAIMQYVKEETQGTFKIGPATLYTIIKKLLGAGLIEAEPESDPRRKTYAATAAGITKLEEEVERRKRMVDLGMCVLQAKGRKK
ncbi:transcriptional regulator, PadR family [Terribacillus aidingensis]|uniref:Transcriptional regulator, PadR family n=1 Tax=Terribacillus aidingensis TaxID=586416 RepID=A0A285P4E2_9BACI|nr:PadR family transcriptional regulator [Terribacillus aidingensis]SNZ16137.1 transcriptional regulator, PadR family [Terribacillus aidingensis]